LLTYNYNWGDGLMKSSIKDNDDETRAYQLIIDAIAPGSRVEVTEDQVRIHGSNLPVQEVERLLANPERFRSVVGKYVFTPINNEDSAEAGVGLNNGTITRTLAIRSKTSALPHDFLKALFGPTILGELNMHAIAPSNLTEIDGNLIYNIVNYQITESLWAARVQMLKRIIQSAGLSGIEQVFSAGTPLQLSGVAPMNSELAKKVDDIIGIKVDKHEDGSIKQAFFYLNKRFIINNVFAPEVVEEGQDEASKAIVIDKSQFCDYLGQVFGDMVVPAQDHPNELEPHGPTLVTPIIIPVSVANSLNKQNVYIFVIDISGSLANVTDEYKDQLINMLDRLVSVIKESAGQYVNPKDLIRLVFFSDTSRYVDFPVTEVINNIENLKQCIASATIGGQTFLDGTIALQIDALAELCEKTCNANMFIFTDGMDNKSTVEEKQALTLHGDQFRAQKTDLIPKFKIFRVGEADVSKIDAISKGIDAEIYDITDVSGLERVFKQMRDLNLHRDLVKFVQDQYETMLSVYEGRLTTGPSLDITKKVQVKGRMYNIESSPEYNSNAIKELNQQEKPADDSTAHPSRMVWMWNQCTAKNVGIAATATSAMVLPIAYRLVYGGPQ
jgi:hypothetical protein